MVLSTPNVDLYVYRCCDWDQNMLRIKDIIEITSLLMDGNRDSPNTYLT